MIKRVDKRLQAVQCLTGNKIKIIACITMLIDHFSKIFLESIMNDKLFPLYLAGGMSTEQFYGIDAFQKNILNGIGTIAFPLFCLLLSEGFFYTKNRKRYIGGMLAFALISEVPFDIGFFSRYSIAEGTFPFYLQYADRDIAGVVGITGDQGGIREDVVGRSDVHIISGVEFCSARPIDTRGDTFSRCCRFILRSNRFRCSEGGDSHINEKIVDCET